MRHRSMTALAEALASEGVATLRYNFPYKEFGRPVPDAKPVLYRVIRESYDVAALSGLPVFAGGRSYGGRMTSMAEADQPIEGLKGIVFFGFPLHPHARPGVGRAEHLAKVSIPMLFHQGTRDTLAELPLLEPIVAALPIGTLQIHEGADHSFGMLKSSGMTSGELLQRMAQQTADWMAQAG